MGNIGISTELLDYYVPMSVLTPEQDIEFIYSDSFMGVFSIGDNKIMYLTYECTEEAVRWKRVKLFEQVDHFQAVRVGTSDSFIIALISAEKVRYAVTEKPESLDEDSFLEIDFSGVLRGKTLIPNRVILNALDETVTIGIEMKDASGRIEQFTAMVSSGKMERLEYFPLAANYSEVRQAILGRAAGQYVDGIYTYGTYGDTDTLLYTPVMNVFGSTPPAPVRFQAPEGDVDCICTCILEKREGTHLFICSAQKLYYYPYRSQSDVIKTGGGVPVLLCTDELLEEVRQMISYIEGNRLYVWALNGSGVLSYMFAELADGELGEFTEPLPFREGVYDFTILNDKMFLCTKDTFMEGEKDADTGLWKLSEIRIDTGLEEVDSVFSYCTKIYIEKGAGTKVKIELSCKDRAGLYVQGIFHRFHTITAETDYMGCVNIVQQADDMNPVEFDVTAGDETVHVNPAEEKREKVLSLDTAEKINTAKIKDIHGEETLLLPNGNPQKIEAAAAGIAALQNSRNSLNGLRASSASAFPNGVTVQFTAEGVIIAQLEHPMQINGIFDDILYSIEDVFNLIKKGIEELVSFTITIVGEVWKFIVRIGEDIFSFVLDTIGKIVACAVKLLEFIGIPVHKLLDWLKAFLDIDGAVRIKNACKNLVMLGEKEIENSIDGWKQKMIAGLDDAIEKVEDWAGISGDLPEPGTTGMEKYKMFQNPANMYLSDLIFKNGAVFSAVLPDIAPPDELRLSMKKLSDCIAVTPGFDSFQDLFTELAEEIAEISGSTVGNLLDLLKKLVGIFAVKGLNIAKTLIDAIMDFLKDAIAYMARLIDTPLHIPFVSQVFALFGIEEFSILDVILMVPAFAGNLIYKLVSDVPLIDEDLYNAIENADSIQSVINYLQGVENFEYNSLVSAGQVCLEASDKILPRGKTGRTVKAMKWLLGLFSVGEVIAQAYFYGAYGMAGSTNHKQNMVSSGCSFCFTLVGFVCSMVSGNLYSPMNDKFTETTIYTDLWYAKTCSMAAGSATTFVSEWMQKSVVEGETEEETSGDKPGKGITAAKVFKMTFSGISAALCLTALVFESMGLDKARNFKANGDEQLTDKKIYLTEAAGYILDDLKSITDAVITFLAECGVDFQGYLWGGIIVGRTLVGAGGAIAQFVSYGFLEDYD